MGVVGLTIERLDQAPDGIDELQSWQAVSEASVEATGSTVAPRLLMDAPDEPFDGIIDLPDGPGWYRVRAHAIGRGLDYDDVVDENPREHHLLQIWRSGGPQPALRGRGDSDRPGT